MSAIDHAREICKAASNDPSITLTPSQAKSICAALLARDRQVRELAELVKDYEMLLLCRGNRKELADVQAKLARIMGAEDGQ